ncbi:MAG: hypothetical protein ACI4AM_09505 [Muribaculaceae bacterium]
MNTPDLDLIKQQWQQLSVKVDNLEQANQRLSDQLARNNAKSFQERLAGRIKRISWAGLLLPVLAPMLYFSLQMPVWICFIYAIYGIAMCILNRRLSAFILSKNLLEISATEALQHATAVRLYQKNVRILGSLLAILLLFGMYYVLPPSEHQDYILMGGLVGMVLGLAFAIPRCITNARLARRMAQSLTDPD